MWLELKTAAMNNISSHAQGLRVAWLFLSLKLQHDDFLIIDRNEFSSSKRWLFWWFHLFTPYSTNIKKNRINSFKMFIETWGSWPGVKLYWSRLFAIESFWRPEQFSQWWLENMIGHSCLSYSLARTREFWLGSRSEIPTHRISRNELTPQIEMMFRPFADRSTT